MPFNSIDKEVLWPLLEGQLLELAAGSALCKLCLHKNKLEKMRMLSYKDIRLAEILENVFDIVFVQEPPLEVPTCLWLLLFLSPVDVFEMSLQPVHQRFREALALLIELNKYLRGEGGNQKVEQLFEVASGFGKCSGWHRIRCFFWQTIASAIGLDLGIVGNERRMKERVSQDSYETLYPDKGSDLNGTSMTYDVIFGFSGLHVDYEQKHRRCSCYYSKKCRCEGWCKVRFFSTSHVTLVDCAEPAQAVVECQREEVKTKGDEDIFDYFDSSVMMEAPVRYSQKAEAEEVLMVSAILGPRVVTKVVVGPMPELTLEVWPSDFLLPSIDAKCLQFMACVRFSSAPVKIVTAATPWNTLLGNYPNVLGVSPLKTSNDYKGFVYLLQNRCTDEVLDMGLQEHLNEMEELKSLTIMRIYPAYLYTFWMNKYNLQAITERWYCEQLGFFYSSYFVRKMKRKAEACVLHSLGQRDKLPDLEQKVMENAEYALRVLSERLGYNKYFFGNQPSSLDAFVFGYLAPLLYVPLPDNRMQNFIRENCYNLYQLVNTVISVHMPLSDGEVSAHQERLAQWQVYCTEYRVKRDANVTNKSDTKYPLWEKIAFGAAVICLSLAFAIGCGVIQIEVRRISSQGTTVAENDTKKS